MWIFPQPPLIAVADPEKILLFLKNKIHSDSKLLSSHKALLEAIILIWQNSGFLARISISRKKVMLIAKISSLETYHKRMKDLIAYRYFNYTPSFHPKIGSLVSWIHEDIL